MPVASAYLPDEWPLTKELSARVEKDFSGKISAYVRDVIERDLRGDNGVPDATSPTILEDLCKRLRGERADVLRAALATAGFSWSYSERLSPEEKKRKKEQAAPINQQPRILADLIEALIDYAEDKGTFFQGRFTLVSSSRFPLARLVDEALEENLSDPAWSISDEIGESYRNAVAKEHEILNAASRAIDALLPAPARRRKHPAAAYLTEVERVHGTQPPAGDNLPPSVPTPGDHPASPDLPTAQSIRAAHQQAALQKRAWEKTKH